ncbi:methylmalonyl-CoA mutase family protein, partial [Streptomyces sp. NPDC021562]|uniref:methylmalonyl-CoA mutase family protein n=1 Tax=Streptomyces sp. NPDC021562 TaxID=3155121 RepID=UPI0033F28B9F
VEELGGAVAAIERGFQKGEIERNAYRIAQETDAGEHCEPLRVDPAVERRQAERLCKVRAWREQSRVDSALDQLKKAARGDDNVLYPMKEALCAHATVGEVCGALREVWGGYVAPDAIRP